MNTSRHLLTFFSWEQVSPFCWTKIYHLDFFSVEERHGHPVVLLLSRKSRIIIGNPKKTDPWTSRFASTKFLSTLRHLGTHFVEIFWRVNRINYMMDMPQIIVSVQFEGDKILSWTASIFTRVDLETDLPVGLQLQWKIWLFWSLPPDFLRWHAKDIDNWSNEAYIKHTFVNLHISNGFKYRYLRHDLLIFII